MKRPSFRFGRQSRQQPVVRRRLADRAQPTATETPVQGQGTLPTFSYRRATSTSTQSESSFRSTVHELRRRQRSLWSLLLGTMAVVAGLGIVVYQTVLTVDVSLYGQVGAISQTDKKAFEQAVEEYYGAHPLQRIRLLLDRDMMLRWLQQRGYPEVKGIVSFDPAGIGRAAIAFKVRQPLASWTISGRQFYVDADGVVFGRNLYQAPSIVVRDESGITSQVDRPIASSRLLEFIGQVSGYFTSQGVTVTTVILPANTTRQVQFILADDSRIKMTIDRPAGEQAEDATRAVAYFTSTGQARPEYIDVRVSRVAYYK